MKKLQKIPCAACKEDNVVAETVLYQTNWYVEGDGHGGGSYWREGEQQFICGHCDAANRMLYNDGVYDSKRNRNVSPSEERFEANAQYFKKIVQTHDEDDPSKRRKWVNNYFGEKFYGKEAAVEDKKLRDALDGLFAYDTGCVDSGIKDEKLRREVKKTLASWDSDTYRYWMSQYVRKNFLSDSALKAGYGIEDVGRFIRWLDEKMGL